MRARLIALSAFACAASVLCASGLHAQEPGAGQISPKAAEAIRMIKSSDEYQRAVGFLRLEALREPATAAAIRPLANSKNHELRAQALRALAAIEGAAAVPLLVERLQRDKVAYVRRSAVLGLEALAAADPAVLPALIAAVRDRNPQVRMAAIDAVSRIKDPSAREALISRKRREGHRDVRRVLRMALDRIGS